MSDQSSYLIVGSNGTIGSALLAHLPSGKATGASRRLLLSGNQVYLDLSGDIERWPIPDGIQVIVNCAAVARLEACKRDPEGSRRVNVESVIALAEKCRRAGVFFIHLSSDKVFSGQYPRMAPDAPLAPITEYGRQKAEAERHLLKMLSAGTPLAIIRLTKALTPGMALFRGWRDALLRGEAIHPFADMTLAPLPLPFVVEAIARVVDQRRTGVFQLSGAQDITYEDVALRLAERLSVATELIQGTSAAVAGAIQEAVPAYTSLDTEETRRALNLDWPETFSTLDWAFSQL